MIIVENLRKEFEGFVAVDDVSFSIDQGEVLALLGPNGAGKTTTIRMITSLLKPTRGHVTVLGHNVVEDAHKVRMSMGVLSENHGLYNRMGAYEYLDFFGQIYGLTPSKRKERITYLLDKFGLVNVEKKKVGEFSKGMRQKLALARSLVHDPPVLLLDEPTSAMDPESARLVRDLIKDLKSSKRTILICTHNLAEAEELASKIAIIRKGNIVANGTASELRTKLLGPKLVEVKFSKDVEFDPAIFDSKIEIVNIGRDWFQYKVDEPENANPYVLDILHDKKIDVMYLSEVSQSLEKVYLQAVSEKGENNEKH